MQRLQPIKDDERALARGDLRQLPPALDGGGNDGAVMAEKAERPGDDSVVIGGAIVARALAIGGLVIDLLGAGKVSIGKAVQELQQERSLARAPAGVENGDIGFAGQRRTVGRGGPCAGEHRHFGISADEEAGRGQLRDDGDAGGIPDGQGEFRAAEAGSLRRISSFCASRLASLT